MAGILWPGGNAAQGQADSAQHYTQVARQALAGRNLSLSLANSQKAVALYNTIGDSLTARQAYALWGEGERRLGHASAAEALLRKAVRLSRQAGDNAVAVQALYSLATVQDALPNPAAAAWTWRQYALMKDSLLASPPPDNEAANQQATEAAPTSETQAGPPQDTAEALVTDVAPAATGKTSLAWYACLALALLSLVLGVGWLSARKALKRHAAKDSGPDVAPDFRAAPFVPNLLVGLQNLLSQARLSLVAKATPGEPLAEVEADIAACTDELRYIRLALQPELVARAGFDDALQIYMRHLGRLGQQKLTARIQPVGHRLSAEAQAEAWAALQQLLDFVRSEREATEITFEVLAADTEVFFVLEDNAPAAEPSAWLQAPSPAMAALRQSVERMAAHLEVRTLQGVGNYYRIKIPALA